MKAKGRFVQRALRGSTALQALALVGAGIGALAAAVPAAAQDITSGSVSGVVRTAGGAPIADATVTLLSTDRGSERRVTTNAQGQFTAPQLPTGVYRVTITAAGYQATQTDDVRSELGGASYTFTMNVAPTEAAADIVVTGRPQRAIDFSSTATGQVFNVQQVASQLPVARNATAVQLLAPQAVPGDSAFGNNASFAGSSVAENIYYINGMNITNFRTFVGGSTIPFEFYDTLQVKTGGYQAEFGRNTGGAVIALSRSGTNEFRGGFNVYYSPNWASDTAPNTYAAHNKFDQRDNIEGNIWASGPIIKDHLFFFAFLNPRDFFQQDTSWSETFNAAGTASTGFVDNTVRKQFQNAPFYGGKLDLNVIDGQRFELTYFNDSADTLIK